MTAYLAAYIFRQSRRATAALCSVSWELKIRVTGPRRAAFSNGRSDSSWDRSSAKCRWRNRGQFSGSCPNHFPQPETMNKR